MKLKNQRQWREDYPVTLMRLIGVIFWKFYILIINKRLEKASIFCWSVKIQNIESVWSFLNQSTEERKIR